VVSGGRNFVVYDSVKGHFFCVSDVVLAWWCFINNNDFPSVESWFNISAG
jgi:hypothetical protein